MRTRALALVAVLMCGACSPVAPPVSSPSGAYAVRTEVSGDEAGPTRRLCIKLKVTDNAGRKEMEFQTGASHGQKWAVDWSRDDVLVLYSSDVGIYAYDIREGTIAERVADVAEQEVARTAYEKKYGKRPRG